MVFPAVQFTGCFPEAHGLVLLDPARLDRFMGGEAAGHNLLELFSTTEAGDAVTRAGIAIPLTGLTPALYTVLVRHVSEPSPWSTAALSSPGWILGTETGTLLLCGAGYLTHWTPEHDRHRRLAVTPGWYSVDIREHQQAAEPDDAGYEFVLTPASAQPPFAATWTNRSAGDAVTEDGSNGAVPRDQARSAVCREP